MVIIACKCPEGFGLAHTHIPKQFVFKRHNSEIEITIDQYTADMNAKGLMEDWSQIGAIPEHIKVWIDWKAVARSLMDVV